MWVLVDDLIFRSSIVGEVVVPRGFETDFASVPRIPLAYWLTGDTAHLSAVVHDYLCRIWLPAGRIDWYTAADVFLEAMRDEGVRAWRRRLMYWAVKYFGGPIAKEV
jgi:hypothetical protein